MIRRRQNWWVAGMIAFMVGVGVGTLGDRNWQRGLAVGAIGMSAVVTVGTLQERRRLEDDPPAGGALTGGSSPTKASLGSTGLAFLDALPLQSIRDSIQRSVKRSVKQSVALVRSRTLKSKKPLPAGRSPLRPSSPQSFSPTSSAPQPLPAIAPPASIPQLQSQLNQVNDRRQQVEAVISVLRQERDSLQSQILEETQQKQNLYRVLSDLEIRKANLEEKLVQQQESVQVLAKQKTDLEQAIAAMGTLGSEVERLRQEREKLAREVRDLEDRDAKLRKDYGTLENKARKLVRRLKQLKNTNS
ncbi:MAG: hypothetical protein AAF889_14885 [Cyanobacteria bacterium P01_D01_bin.73]